MHLTQVHYILKSSGLGLWPGLGLADCVHLNVAWRRYVFYHQLLFYYMFIEFLYAIKV